MAKAFDHGVDRLQALRGMVDLLPNQTCLWQQIESKARAHFRRASISEIRTPLLEVTELFSRGIGECTDVVGKEMYSFFDKGERSCTLRPEGTASVVRATIQHALLSQGPQKLWYSGPMFRYERPQAGRQRQFHQIGVEFLGFNDPRSDIEAIAIAWDLLKDLGVSELNLELNSLGDNEDRNNYKQILISWMEERRELLDKDSLNRIKSNPLRILDSKVPSTQDLLKDAPILLDSLSAESMERLEKVKDGLIQLEIPFEINPRLVRGLDYYNHTAFEITSKQLGAQSTVCGGGRYDNLIGQLGGPNAPAIGWALGMERLLLLISQYNQEGALTGPSIYIVNRGEEAERFALVVSRNLRKRNQTVEIDLTGSSFGKQLKRANRSGAKWALIIGDQEALQGEVILKDMQANGSKDSQEESFKLESLLKRFA